MRTEFGGIAQLGERLNGIQEVSGSIPLISTMMNPWKPSVSKDFFALGETGRNEGETFDHILDHIGFKTYRLSVANMIRYL